MAMADVAADVDVFCQSLNAWVTGRIAAPVHEGLLTVHFDIDGVQARKHVRPTSENLRVVECDPGARRRYVLAKKGKDGKVIARYPITQVFKLARKSWLESLWVPCGGDSNTQIRDSTVMCSSGRHSVLDDLRPSCKGCVEWASQWLDLKDLRQEEQCPEKEFCQPESEPR